MIFSHSELSIQSSRAILKVLIVQIEAKRICRCAAALHYCCVYGGKIYFLCGKGSAVCKFHRMSIFNLGKAEREREKERERDRFYQVTIKDVQCVVTL